MLLIICVIVTPFSSFVTSTPTMADDITEFLLTSKRHPQGVLLSHDDVDLSSDVNGLDYTASSDSDSDHSSEFEEDDIEGEDDEHDFLSYQPFSAPSLVNPAQSLSVPPTDHEQPSSSGMFHACLIVHRRHCARVGASFFL